MKCAVWCLLLGFLGWQARGCTVRDGFCYLDEGEEVWKPWQCGNRVEPPPNSFFQQPCECEAYTTRVTYCGSEQSLKTASYALVHGSSDAARQLRQLMAVTTLTLTYPADQNTCTAGWEATSPNALATKYPDGYVQLQHELLCKQTIGCQPVNGGDDFRTARGQTRSDWGLTSEHLQGLGLGSVEMSKCNGQTQLQLFSDTKCQTPYTAPAEAGLGSNWRVAGDQEALKVLVESELGAVLGNPFNLPQSGSKTHLDYELALLIGEDHLGCRNDVSAYGGSQNPSTAVGDNVVAVTPAPETALSTEQWIGIIVGVAAAVCIAFLLVWFCVWEPYNKRQHEKKIQIDADKKDIIYPDAVVTTADPRLGKALEFRVGDKVVTDKAGATYHGVIVKIDRADIANPYKIRRDDGAEKWYAQSHLSPDVPMSTINEWSSARSNHDIAAVQHAYSPEQDVQHKDTKWTRCGQNRWTLPAHSYHSPHIAKTHNTADKVEHVSEFGTGKTYGDVGKGYHHTTSTWQRVHDRHDGRLTSPLDPESDPAPFRAPSSMQKTRSSRSFRSSPRLLYALGPSVRREATL